MHDTVTLTLPDDVAQAVYDLARDFAEHESYGQFLGGDPRTFTPDPECSTPEERAAHKAACDAYDRSEREPTEVVSVAAAGKATVLTHYRNFGLGTNVLREPRYKAFCEAVDAARVAGHGSLDVEAMEARALAATPDVRDDGCRLQAPPEHGGEIIAEYKLFIHPNAQNDGAFWAKARANVLTLVARLRERDAEYLSLARQTDDRGFELRNAQTEAHTARRERDEAHGRIAKAMRCIDREFGHGEDCPADDDRDGVPGACECGHASLRAVLEGAEVPA